MAVPTWRSSWSIGIDQSAPPLQRPGAQRGEEAAVALLKGGKAQRPDTSAGGMPHHTYLQRNCNRGGQAGRQQLWQGSACLRDKPAFGSPHDVVEGAPHTGRSGC